MFRKFSSEDFSPVVHEIMKHGAVQRIAAELFLPNLYRAVLSLRGDRSMSLFFAVLRQAPCRVFELFLRGVEVQADTFAAGDIWTGPFLPFTDIQPKIWS